MVKTHYATGADSDVSVCGRGKRLSSNTRYVDCGLCQNKSEFIKARDEAAAQREAEFQAQTPRAFGEPWRDGNITCKCGSQLFRYRGRSCHGHYDDFVCSMCGETTSRLTETGMSF